VAVRRKVKVCAVGIVLAAAIGCSRAPLRVDTIQLGRALNPDNSVANHTSTFRHNDTVYVAVLTADRGAGTLGAKWSYGGRVIDEPTKRVRYHGAAATEFHLQSAAGFPPGDYKVEIYIDGSPAGSRSFRVDH
jgi:hypothetical protein